MYQDINKATLILQVLTKAGPGQEERARLAEHSQRLEQSVQSQAASLQTLQQQQLEQQAVR